jgi:hypothetical protein
MIVRTLLVVAGLCLAASAGAQTAPATAAPAGNKPASHSCQKPGEHPGRLGSDTVRRKWVSDANGYLECLKKYITENTTSFNTLVEQAKPYAEAANKAAEEYNGAVKSLKEEQDKNN